jgi:hypothetical protein
LIINIISKQCKQTKVRGPGKVLNNAIKGLDIIGVNYVFNKPISKYQYNWIHDSKRAIIEAGFTKKPVLVGPNIAVLPSDLPKLRKVLSKYSTYLHPSYWVVKMWGFLGFKECNLDDWPVGIDTNEFAQSHNRKNKVLIYFKDRNPKILTKVKNTLYFLNLDYDLIIYGSYKEKKI